MSIPLHLPGGIPVYGFALILAASAALGLFWMARRAPEEQAQRQVDTGLWVLLGGLVGGRAAFVLANWAYFREHLSQIPAIPLGGISGAGALAGGLLCLMLAARLERAPLGVLADTCLPLLTTLTIGAWLGCWLDGSAYGPQANYWWGIPTRDEWGALSLRWPTQLIGALLSLALFILLDWRQRAGGFKAPGRQAALAVLGISVQLWALSFLRADPAPIWYGLRAEAWAWLSLAGLAAAALGYSILNQTRLRGSAV